MKKTNLFAAAAMTLLMSAAAFAGNHGVVNVQKVYAESKTGKAAAEHMKSVQKVLQKGMDEVILLQKGKEKTPEGQRAILEAQQLLNRQLAVEQQAVNAILEKELRAACDAWLKAHKTYSLLLPEHLALASTPAVEFTKGVTAEMNKRPVPRFPDLPKVTVNKPQPAAAEKPVAGKPAADEPVVANPAKSEAVSEMKK